MMPPMMAPQASQDKTESPLAGIMDKALAMLIQRGPQAMQIPQVERAILLGLDGKGLARSTPAKQGPMLNQGPQPMPNPSAATAGVGDMDRQMMMARMAQAARMPGGPMPGPVPGGMPPNPAILQALAQRQGMGGPGATPPMGGGQPPMGGGIPPEIAQKLAMLAAMRGAGGAVGAV